MNYPEGVAKFFMAHRAESCPPRSDPCNPLDPRNPRPWFGFLDLSAAAKSTAARGFDGSGGFDGSAPCGAQQPCAEHSNVFVNTLGKLLFAQKLPEGVTKVFMARCMES